MTSALFYVPSGGWTASFIGRFPDKYPSSKELAEKQESTEGRVNLKVIEVFSRLRPCQEPAFRGRQIDYQVMDLKPFFEALQKCDFFSSKNMCAKEGFPLIDAVKKACLQGNRELAIQLLLAGAPVNSDAIIEVIKKDWKDVFAAMYPQMSHHQKRGIFPKLCQREGYGEFVVKAFKDEVSNFIAHPKLLEPLFDLSDHVALFELMQFGLQTNPLEKKTLLHVAAALASPALIAKLLANVNWPMGKLHEAFFQIGEKSESIKDCRDAVFLLLEKITFLSPNFTEKMAAFLHRLISIYYKDALQGGQKKPAEEKYLEEMIDTFLQKANTHGLADSLLKWPNSQASLLIRAVTPPGLKGVARLLLKWGAPLSPITNHGDNLLHWLAVQNTTTSEGFKEVVEDILEKLNQLPLSVREKILEQKNDGGLTPFLSALNARNEKYADQLIGAGANRKARDTDGWGVTEYAIAKGLSKRLEVEGEELDLSNLNALQGELTPGMYAAEQTKLYTQNRNEIEDAICWFIGKGGNSAIQDSKGKTIWHMAAKLGLIKVLQRPLESNPLPADLNALDAHGMTCLSFLSGSGLEIPPSLIIDLVKKGGIDLTITSKEGKWSAFGLAASRNRSQDVLDALLPEIRNEKELRPFLSDAIRANSPLAVERCLARAKEKKVQFNLESSLKLAIQRGASKAFSVLSAKEKEVDSNLFAGAKEFANEWEVEAWLHFWPHISEKEKKALKRSQLMAKSIKKGDVLLCDFFLKNQFLVSGKCPVELISSCPESLRDFRVPLFKQFLKKIQKDRKFFKENSSQDFTPLLDADVGNLSLEVKIGNQSRTFNVISELLEDRSPVLHDEITLGNQIDLAPFVDPLSKGIDERTTQKMLNGFEAILRCIYSKKIENVAYECASSVIFLAAKDKLDLESLQVPLKEWREKHPAFAKSPKDQRLKKRKTEETIPS